MEPPNKGAKPWCQDGGVGGNGCKAPNMNPALQPRAQPMHSRGKPEREPLGGKAGPTPRLNPGWDFGTPLLWGVPPAVLL